MRFLAVTIGMGLWALAGAVGIAAAAAPAGSRSSYSSLEALGGTSGAPIAKAVPGGVRLSHSLITLSEEALVPAKEAGALVKINVKDGDTVTRDQLLAQIDDTHSQAELRAATYKHQVAKEESENDINVRYSAAAAEVARAQVLTGEESNRRVPGSVTESQMREWRLTHKKFILEIEQAEFKRHTSGLEAMVRKAEVDTAQENINRRQIRAPLDGVVVDLKRHEGEWVQAGEGLLKLVRIDRLRIEGFLPAQDYSRSDIDRRPVEVEVELAHGRKEKFEGKVVFVNPMVEASGEFRVRVEVLNRKENDYWLLSPGLTAEMTIKLR